MNTGQSGFVTSVLTPLMPLVAVSFCLAACSATPPEPTTPTAATFAAEGEVSDPQPLVVRPAPAATQDTVVCREVATSGTHFKRRRCTTDRQRTETRQAAQRWLRTGGREGAPVGVH